MKVNKYIIVAFVLLVLISTVTLLWPKSGDLSNPMSNPSESMYDQYVMASSQEMQPGWQTVAENSNLRMDLDESTLAIRVLHKPSDKMWYSNPIFTDEDQTISPAQRELLSSQLSMSYYSSKGQLVQFDSFTHSVMSKQYGIQRLEDGVKFIFQFGDLSKSVDQAIPKRISKERFENVILANMPDEQTVRDFKKRFRFIEEENVYERRDTGINFVREVVEKYDQILQSIGYTEEDLRRDNEENNANIVIQEREVFVIPIEFTLDQHNLRVHVPMNEVIHPEKLNIHSLSILRYFGAADQNADGYMFVPDGSGALIHLNNNKKTATRYNTKVYGYDYAKPLEENYNESETTRLPVFGMKQGEHAWIGIIENGEAVANIVADIGGKIHPYNYIHAEFITLPEDQLTITGGTNKNTVFIFPKQMYEGDITIKFGFLTQEKANYAGMAEYYRNYLFKHAEMTRVAAGNHPFYLELTGAIKKRKFILGIPYQAEVTLTRFEDAATIIDQLMANDINNIQLRYTGWMNGGYYHEIPLRVSVDRALGGKKGFLHFIEKLKEKNVQLYPDVSFVKVYDGKNFSPSRDGGRGIDKKPIELSPFNPVTMQEGFGMYTFYGLSPSKLDKVVDKFNGKYDDYGVKGLSLRDLGDLLNSDFRESHIIDRQEAKEIVTKQLEKMKQHYTNIMVSGGNSYALPYANHVVNIPNSSSGFDITDESVPFYQMVLHGYVDYATTPANLYANQDTRMYLLKSLETGSNIFFQWFYEPLSATKNTPFDWMYASHYGTWLEEAVQIYKEFNEVLGPVRGQTMVNHAKLSEGVYATTFESGYQVIVNYNDYAVTIDDQRIESKGYAVRGDVQ